ncbi:MAG TPA: VCBS repeat-containing protein, partial [Acidimicrobiia bacterium]
MTDTDGAGRPKSIAWLVGGTVSGALATLAIFFLVAAWIDRGPADQVAGPPLFEEVTEYAGVDHVYDGGFQFFVGGGVAVFDCNDDRMPDLFVAGGTNESGLYVNDGEIGGKITLSRMLPADTGLPGVTGAYPIDVDSDGLTDLAVLRVGENVMLRGTGDCRFERGNETWGIDGGEHWTVAFSARWEDGPTRPTLAFGNYLRLGDSGERDECEDHFLSRPDGDRYFGPESLSPGYCALSILFSDWNRSGRADLRMTNDRHYYTDGQEQLWHTDGASPAQYSSEDGWRSLKIWGMGIASQDLDQDGLPEVFLTSQGDNKLQTLTGGPGQPNYEDIALASGVTAHRPFAGDTLRPSTAWHAEFDDVNNDGFMDLFITKGNVEA